MRKKRIPLLYVLTSATYLLQHIVIQQFKQKKKSELTLIKSQELLVIQMAERLNTNQQTFK